jgi:hypothetical protein
MPEHRCLNPVAKRETGADRANGPKVRISTNSQKDET